MRGIPIDIVCSTVATVSCQVSGNGQVELANVICGIEKEFQGRVLINSQDVSKKGVKSRKKLSSFSATID